jgi:hypothetical protein
LNKDDLGALGAGAGRSKSTDFDRPRGVGPPGAAIPHVSDAKIALYLRKCQIFFDSWVKTENARVGVLPPEGCPHAPPPTAAGRGSVPGADFLGFRLFWPGLAGAGSSWRGVLGLIPREWGDFGVVWCRRGVSDFL